MANSDDITSADRDLLEFRPEIDYTEPDIETRDVASREEIVDVQIPKVRSLARNVGTLAAAVQTRADIRAKGFQIKLKPGPDSAVIQVMKRHYPDADPTVITYEQYRSCKEAIARAGLDNAKRAQISNEEVEAARPSTDPNGVGTSVDKFKGGGLRPELNEKIQFMEPVDLEEYQDETIKEFVNFIWKNFIKKTIPLPPGVPGLPDEIA